MGYPESEFTFVGKKKTIERAKLFVKMTKMSKNAVFFAGSRIRNGIKIFVKSPKSLINKGLF